MPEKLHDCVRDVKGTGKSDDSAWAICNDAIKEEVQTALGIAGVGETCPYEIKEEVATALGIAGVGTKESDTALSIAGVGESVSIGGKKKLEEIGKDITKQLLETQIGECPCKNKNRPKA